MKYRLLEKKIEKAQGFTVNYKFLSYPNHKKNNELYKVRMLRKKTLAKLKISKK